MADGIARDVIVRGDVQGVFFRDSTRRVASSAGVAGRAYNEPDGSVRIHLEGPATAVEQVLDFVRTGPPQATVDDVSVTDAQVEGLTDFRIG